MVRQRMGVFRPGRRLDEVYERTGMTTMRNKLVVSDLDMANRRVLVRVDFNVPLQDGRVVDDSRIRAALPTIEYLRRQGAKVILVSHLGRPEGEVVESLRMAPVAERLGALLGEKVRTVNVCVGPEAEAAVAAMEPGGLLLLENVRFYQIGRAH